MASTSAAADTADQQTPNANPSTDKAAMSSSSSRAVHPRALVTPVANRTNRATAANTDTGDDPSPLAAAQSFIVYEVLAPGREAPYTGVTECEGVVAMDDMCSMLLRKEGLLGVSGGDFLCFIDGERVPATSVVPMSPSIISFCVEGREHSVVSEGVAHFFLMLGHFDAVVHSSTCFTDRELNRVAALCKHASIPYDKDIGEYTMDMVDKKREEMEVETTRVELLREIVAIASKNKTVTTDDLKQIGKLQKSVLKTFASQEKRGRGIFNTDGDDDEMEFVVAKKQKASMKEKVSIQPSVQTVISSFDDIEDEDCGPVITSGKKKMQRGRGARMDPRYAAIVDAYVTREMDLGDAVEAAQDDLDSMFGSDESLPDTAKITNRIRNKRNQLKKK